MPQQYSTLQLAEIAWEEEQNALVNAEMDAIQEEAAEMARDAVSDAASEILGDSGAVNDYLDALEDAYNDAMDAIQDSWGGSACHVYCSDNNNNGIPDSWDAMTDYENGLDNLEDIMADFDISDELNDAYSQAYDEALQELLDQNNVDLPISDFWAEDDQDIVNFTDVSLADQQAINEVFQELCDNCLYTELIEQIRGQGVGYANDPTRLPPGTGGLYDPQLNSIVFDGNVPNAETIAAELFHAYQDQLHGDLQAILNHPDNLGGSNIEFEETLMSFPAYVDIILTGELPMTGYSDPAGMENVGFWLADLCASNGGVFPTVFTNAQKAEYLNFVELFRLHHQQAGTPGIRDGAVDPQKDTPDALMLLLANSNCN